MLNNKTRYAWAFGDEWTSYDFLDTVEKALSDAVENIDDNIERDEKGEFVYVGIGKSIPYEDRICARDIIDDMRDKAVSECMENFADDYLENVDTTWLQEKLDEIWLEFKKRENVQPAFGYIEDDKLYKVYVVNDGHYGYTIKEYIEVEDE